VTEARRNNSSGAHVLTLFAIPTEERITLSFRGLVMRLKVSVASANEQLIALTTRGYQLHANLWTRYREENRTKTFNEEEAQKRDGEAVNTWGNEVLTVLGGIFPTELESHQFLHPESPFGAVADPHYSWKCLTNHLMDLIRGLDRLRVNSLPQYTDLPIKERFHVEDIDSFQKVRDVNPQMVVGFLDNGYLDLGEEVVQMALEAILGVLFHKKDWGGETNDLYTANVLVNGCRRPTAFMLKGNGLKNRVMEVKHCGKNGDQVLRLFQSPAELFVIQFVGTIAESVIAQAHGEIARLKTQGKESHFLIMDGQDTARVLRAYGKL
jgi:hypothetical protein